MRGNLQKYNDFEVFGTPFCSLITDLHCSLSTWNWKKFHKEQITFALHFYARNICGKIFLESKLSTEGSRKVDRSPLDLYFLVGYLETRILSFMTLIHMKRNVLALMSWCKRLLLFWVKTVCIVIHRCILPIILLIMNSYSTTLSKHLPVIVQ